MHSTGSPFRQSTCENKNMFNPSEINPGKHWDVAEEGKELIKPLCGPWKRQEQLSFSCAKSPVHSISELHRIPYVLSIDLHIDLTLLKMITVNFRFSQAQLRVFLNKSMH